MAAPARPGKSFTEMLDLILRHQRRPNDPFSPQLLMAIFWEESLFTNRKQQKKGSAIGFGQAEPAELPKLTTQQARDHGYEVPGVSRATRSLSDELAVTVPSSLLLHMFHSSKAPTREGKVRSALNGYAGVEFQGPSALTREDRLRIIANWRKCEEKLKALPFSVYAIANYAGNLVELEDRYLDALALARAFHRELVLSREPRLLRFRDVLFPPGWSLLGWPTPTSASGSTPRAESLFEKILEERQVRHRDGARFVVLAGPGESIPELASGDLLLRQPRNGGTPRAARIRSAAATPDDFLREGVIAERGPDGYYVEVASGGSYPIARRIADPSGRVAPGRVVLRARGFGEGEGREDLAEETDAELERKRIALVAAITSSDLNWHDVPLKNGYRIRVSSPILKDNVFVPVTAPETMKLARKLEVFPLTRAVMDQAHNVANQVGKQKTPTSLFDFVTYTKRLEGTAYLTQFGYALSSGAHKLWVISSRGPVVNYGFYIPRVRGELVRCGPLLDPQQNVIQGLGTAHNGGHWDYSQMLQFMTGLKDPGGQRVDLRQALLERNPAVWDEAQPPAAGSLP